MDETRKTSCPICAVGESHDLYADHLLLPDGQCPMDYEVWLYRHFRHMCIDMSRSRALARLVEIRRSWAQARRHRTHPDAQRKLAITARAIQAIQCQP